MISGSPPPPLVSLSRTNQTSKLVDLPFDTKLIPASELLSLMCLEMECK